MAKPFIKWVGGKRQLLPELLKYVPKTFGHYYEPFVGGGALFFALQEMGRIQHSATLSDTNVRLIRTYTAIRDSVEDLITYMSEDFEYDEEMYYDTRWHFNEAVRIGRVGEPYSDVLIAAYFIYLNKCGFNGLYRENKEGQMNVPIGRFDKPPKVLDADNLRACSQALQGVELKVENFWTVEPAAQSGDLVYGDPPYIPMSATSSFCSYGADGFNSDMQVKLRNCARRLKDRNINVILSNSSAPAARGLYGGPEFIVVEVDAKRALNCDGDKRGAVKELIIY